MEIKISYEKIDNPDNKEDHFLLYSLIKYKLRYPFDLTKEWIFFSEKSKTLICEKYLILVACDKETYFACYNQLFNPVEIYCQKDENKIINLMIGLRSIDDAYHGCHFKDISFWDFNILFEKTNDYVLTNTMSFNYKDFLKFLTSEGGKDISY